MHITLTPVRRDADLTLHRMGDTLTINGAVYDFSVIPEGATLPRMAVDCDWLASDITRYCGVLHLTLIVPHGADAPPQTLYPAPITLTHNGPVTLPLFAAPPSAAPHPAAPRPATSAKDQPA